MAMAGSDKLGLMIALHVPKLLCGSFPASTSQINQDREAAVGRSGKEARVPELLRALFTSPESRTHTQRVLPLEEGRLQY